MACVEGLLPEPLNSIVLDMFWAYACWHALAKLRLHTETTVDILNDFTQMFGATTRKFALACKDINIRELPYEEASRGRREVNLQVKAARKKPPTDSDGKTAARGSKKKTLNLSTFKFHSLGHYPEAIQRCGTIDNYSTQVVSMGYLPSDYLDLLIR